MNRAFTIVAISLFVTACGGSSEDSGLIFSRYEGSSFKAWQEGVFESPQLFVHQCEAPRSGTNPATNSAYLDQLGSGLDERNWLRSWSNEFYLWYDEIIDRDPASFETLAYFETLKTEAITPSGNPRDQFHFTFNSDDYFSLSESGTAVSTGIRWKVISSRTPRSIRVVFVEPGSPADLAGVERGDNLTHIDGFNVENDNSQLAIDAINQGLSPADENETHTYQFTRRDSNTTYAADISAQEIPSAAVLHSDILNTTSGNVGYMVFNDHSRVAEGELINAVQSFANTGISDLVLDLRYNGGGFLYIASQLSYMIAGPEPTANRIFETLVFNDKHTQTNPFTGETLAPTPFFNGSTSNEALPSLNLERVFVLTLGSTCSASESIINGLRGIDVEVIQIGQPTCGKPYGFYPTDNCGTTYFSINFSGENDKGFGDFADGFIPSEQDDGEAFIRGCRASDDLDHLLGNNEEELLSTALYYRDNNQCPPVAASAQGIQKPSIKAEGYLVRPAVLQNKLMDY